ncbi:M81 family metallopeptidase [Herbaspirillum rubrisubalbicans]|uniref:Microcystinase C n=1 Tax=Herbaspirillum rubrisubalbicans TaxID=80842 RepID=A0ABX9BWJ3_9BURK|nr:M81 family metallopeptidase [Herbaspirillum rubrisubalbicans]RAM62202.1 microcystin degradation protein MlrC [Herbaspirillum rubrisubalbicans]
MQKRILVAGFQHETNTFAPSKAAYENFLKGEGHPPLCRGAEVLALRDVNLPAGGFIQAAEADGHVLVPVLWAGASPSAHVTQDAYERITRDIIAAAGKEQVDAIYLDLHGAMVAEHTDDGEGSLLQALRRAVPASTVIIASLDLHANVTEAMLSAADGLVAYRTYPHVDMADTGRRAYALMQRFLEDRKAICKSSHRLPFLIPINAMCTLIDPAKSIYERMAAQEQGSILSMSFCPGFPAADFPECGPVLWGYGTHPAQLQQAVEALYQRMLDEEEKWEVPFLTPDAAVKEAMRLSASASKPVVIADTQDNPGAGGDANTMGMLRALVDNDAQGAAIGLIYDPKAAAAAHAAGIGARVKLCLGGVAGIEGDSPFEGEFEVIALSDGTCRYDGPMMQGMVVQLGPVAGLRYGGIEIAVGSSKAQMLERNLYRLAGITPEQKKILVNKSSVHFRADFQPIAQAVLVAKAPGPMLANPADLPWRKLRPGMRMSPRGPVFAMVNSGLNRNSYNGS